MHEAPTLFEAGVQDRYDAIVTITAPEEVREQRRPGRRGADGAPAAGSREGRPQRLRVRNTGTLEQLDEFVAGVIRDLDQR